MLVGFFFLLLGNRCSYELFCVIRNIIFLVYCPLTFFLVVRTVWLMKCLTNNTIILYFYCCSCNDIFLQALGLQFLYFLVSALGCSFGLSNLFWFQFAIKHGLNMIMNMMNAGAFKTLCVTIYHYCISYYSNTRSFVYMKSNTDWLFLKCIHFVCEIVDTYGKYTHMLANKYREQSGCLGKNIAKHTYPLDMCYCWSCSAWFSKAHTASWIRRCSISLIL